MGNFLHAQTPGHGRPGVRLPARRSGQWASALLAALLWLPLAVMGQTDLATTVTSSPVSPVTAGTQITYTIDVSNVFPAASGNGDADAVTGTLTFSNASGFTRPAAGTVTVSSVGNSTSNSGYNATTGAITFQFGNNFRNNETPRTASITFTIPTSGVTGYQVVASRTTSSTDNNASNNTQTLTTTVNPLAPPTANNDVVSRSYTSQAAIAILGNDGGGTGQGAINPATVTLIQGAATATAGSGTVPGSNGGTFSVNAAGAVSFTPPAFTGSGGSSSVNYTVRNQASQLSNQATLTVNYTNTAPVTFSNTATTTAGQVLNVSILANDTDADGFATIDVSSVQLSAGSTNNVRSLTGTNNGGTFSVGNSGVVTFVPTPGFRGLTETNYIVFDERGLFSNFATLSVTVNNSAPVANNDVAATTAGTAVVIDALANDTDADGSATITAGSLDLNPTQAGQQTTVNVTGGSFAFANGVVTFTPSAGSSQATVNYTITDDQGAVSNSASITVTVSTTSADVVATLSGPAGGTAPAGSFATYVLTLRNNGSTTATGVAGRIQLPTGLSTVTAANNVLYNPSSGLIQYNPDDLGAGNVRTHTVTFVMPASGSLLGIGSSTSSGTADPSPANNDGSLAAGRVTTTVTQVADVAAVLTAPSAAGPNITTVFNITAVNYGPSTATNVVLNPVISSGLDNVVVSDGGIYNRNTGAITLPAISTLGARTSRGFTVRFTAPGSGSITGSVTASSGTANGDPFSGNNDGSGSSSNLSVRISNTVSSQACLPTTTGTVSTVADQQPNTYYPGISTAPAGTNTLTVGTRLETPDASNIGPGDLVLIIQIQGADINSTNSDAYGDGSSSVDAAANGTLGTNLTAGYYEYRYVADNSATVGSLGGILTFTLPLTNTYTFANATATTGQRRYQVIRVPRYNNLTLGANLAPPAWNGFTGGVLVLEVNGTLNFNGRTINASGRGFRGGAGRTVNRTGGDGSPTTTDFAQPSTVNVHASKGEGIAGTPRYVNNNGTLLENAAEGYPGGSFGRGAPGNAGGGGTDGNVTNNDSNTGGGGGSNGGFGGQGGNAWDKASATGGNGGAPFLAASPSRVIMGGGGGAGTTNNGTGTPGGGFASSGTAGGGIVIINTNQVSGTGTIDVSGASNTTTVLNDGSGGAGAGGTVVLLASSNTSLSGITVLANGGNGGANTGGDTGPHGPGGGGSAGVVFTSGALNENSLILSGNAGLTNSDPGPTLTYGATSGTQFTGAVRNNLVQGDLPNITQASNCTPQPLPVTLTRFEAKASGITAVLSWTTAQERNNDRFEIERSYDGVTYEPVGQVAGHGNATSAHNYAFTDAGVNAALAYYRLRQVDFDGTTALSATKTVSFGVGSSVLLSPNPATETVYLNLLALPESNCTVSVTDATGRQVLNQALSKGAHVPLSVARLVPGVYLLKVQTTSQQVIKRFVKQ